MNMEYTPNAERAIEGAVAAARNFNHSYVGTEHILCSILAIPNCEACRRFERLGLDLCCCQFFFVGHRELGVEEWVS